MLLSILAIVGGLAVLVWSADRFVDGSAAVARYFGLSPLLIGMVVVGFGTSVPEMLVSAFASYQGNPGIALGNAYGSNITNIALILGLTAMLKPITVQSRVLKKELPILTAVTAIAAYQLWNGIISRMDAFILLGVFAVLMVWSLRQNRSMISDAFGTEMEKELKAQALGVRKAVFRLITGLIFLIVSSRMLVWGAVEIAQHFGVSDLIIGLTIVALGTSLPELASSLSAALKGEHDIALGNILGSNLFNTLVVVGIAGIIRPMEILPDVMTRDIPVMTGLTVSLFLFGYGFKGRQGRINRVEGSVLFLAFLLYTCFLIVSVLK
ncbi:calcium/sodium antiporter [bacterium]|nr:calcium/sodium antiporter [candidate division CSSED10-310 bacterium]